MNAVTEPTTPALGTPMEGGFFGGHININGVIGKIIIAPKQDGQFDEEVWNKSYAEVDGAKLFFDGLSNTKAMAEAGSKIAKKVLDLRIGGFDDWHIPAQDVLEIIYRNFKPTAEQNSQFGRSGLNLSAVPPTYPYTPDLPAQTSLEAFKEGGAQAFDTNAYWTSTQHAGSSSCAWFQDFDYGLQRSHGKGYELSVRAVRISI
ncbi:MAG: DUF1566 domain-containing protein [Gallionellaceae bacterium]|jgi:hypothetical protein